MKYNEIEQILKYNEKESQVFLPNEIFDDLKASIKKSSRTDSKKPIEKVPHTAHIAFAYTYLYLINYLYRNVKYLNLDELIDNKKIKEILGYNANAQTVDYLIKKNGLLDMIEYTETVRNVPVSWELEDKELSFMTVSDFDAEEISHLPKLPPRWFMKKPNSAFYRILFNEDNEEYEEVGTFFNTANTHMIPFEVFMYCMSNDDIGCTGFYLYSYLSHKNDIYGGYDIPLPTLSEDSGVSQATLSRILSELRKYRMISVEHNMEYFSLGFQSGNEKRKANTYRTRGYDMFLDKPMAYKKIEVKTVAEHNEIVKKEMEKVIPSTPLLEFNVSMLPY